MPTDLRLVPLTNELMAGPGRLVNSEVRRLPLLDCAVPDEFPIMEPSAYTLTVAGAYWGLSNPAGFC